MSGHIITRVLLTTMVSLNVTDSRNHKLHLGWQRL